MFEGIILAMKGIILAMIFLIIGTSLYGLVIWLDRICDKMSWNYNSVFSIATFVLVLLAVLGMSVILTYQECGSMWYCEGVEND